MTWNCRKWTICLGTFHIHGIVPPKIFSFNLGNTFNVMPFSFITGETEFKHSWPKTVWQGLPKPRRSESGISCFQNSAIIPAYRIPAFIRGMSESFAHSTNLHTFTNTYSPLVFTLPEACGKDPSSLAGSRAALRTGVPGEESPWLMELIPPQAPRMLSASKPHTTYFYHYITWTYW